MTASKGVDYWIRSTLNPPLYFKASFIISAGGLLNGYVKCVQCEIQVFQGSADYRYEIRLDTAVIGPVTTMPMFIDYFGNLSSSLRGIVVSSVLLSATFASLFSGLLSDNMGRTRAVAVGSLIFALGAGIEAGAVGLAMLMVGRTIVGIGEGLFLSTLVL